MTTERRRTARERGAAAVEMALVLPLLLLVIGGIIDLGRMYMGEILVTNAARDGARMASTKYYTSDDVTLQATKAAAGISPFVAPSITVVTWPATTAPAKTTCQVDPSAGASSALVAKVTVTATSFQWMTLNVIPRLVGGNIPAPTISATASMQCS